MKFSEKLQKLRKENNLSQEALADKLDVSRQSVSKWESGQTYPEMDKLLTMCKLFNITLDDLTNDEINFKDVKPKNKNTFDNLIDDVMYIIDKTYSMFTNMNSKERGKIIGELIILFLILLFFRIPFEYIISIGNNVLYHIPTGNYILESLWTFIINIVYLILFIFSFLYIYKTYFLDKYKEKEKTETINEEKEEKKENIINETITEKKHTKEKHTKTHSFGTTLYEILGKITSFCFKTFLVFLSIPFIISFIALFIALFILLILLFKGIFYIGFIICALASIILNYLLLKLITSFLFNYKPKFKFMFTSFIIGISFIGIGTGLIIYDISQTEFIDESPKTKLEYITKTYEYNSDVNLVLENYSIYHPNEITYTVDENINDRIKIEISYYKDINYIDEYTYNYNNYFVVEYDYGTKYKKEIIDIVLDNLKNKEIYNYSKLYGYKLNIISSNKNLENLKSRSKEFKDNQYQNNYYGYEYEIDNLNRINNELYGKIDELNEKISELNEENNNLKTKIREYKENLENILGN